MSAKPPSPIRSLNSVKQPCLLKCFKGTVDGNPVQGLRSFSQLENLLMRERSARAIQQPQDGLPRRCSPEPA